MLWLYISVYMFSYRYMIYRSAWNFARCLDDTKSRFGAQKSKMFTANISKTISRSVTCQLELKSARRELSKNVQHVTVAAQGECLIKKNVYFLPGARYLAPIVVKILNDGRAASAVQWTTAISAMAAVLAIYLSETAHFQCDRSSWP